MSDDLALEASLAELSQFFIGDMTMLDTLNRVAGLAVEAVEPAAFASLTMLIDGDVRTGVFTNDDAVEIDRTQYDAGEGPCLDAFRTGEILRIDSTSQEGRWPAFRQACRRHAIASTASFPLMIDGTSHGALNMFSADEAAFGASEIRLGRSFAAQAGVVIAYARSYWNARQLTKHLEAALLHRAEIEQAKGIIIATTGVDADAAFELLVKQSQHENRKLREVAIELVNSKTKRVGQAAVVPDPAAQ